MCFLLGLILFFGGIAIGGFIVYKWEKEQIEELLKRINDTNERIEGLLDQEEEFMETMWPKQHHNIVMENNLADYLKQKYLDNEFESDCEDESDNLYV